MKIINENYPDLQAPKELSEYADLSRCLFFDIETTGLNKVTTSLYLVGCGFYESGCLNTRFYFADSPDEELNVLKAFFDFTRGFDFVIHFNGTKFDLPYLDYKASKYKIENPLNSIESIDIYKLIKPLRPLLFQESMRQKCVEDFLGILRQDKYNGGELIEVYFEYVKYKSNECFSLLMLHNREDVLGMHKIIPILNYLKLKDCNLSYTGHSINEYEDFEGKNKKEILINYSFDVKIPKSFSVSNNGIYFKFDAVASALTVRMPLTEGVMRHYYENYRDYFYLTEEKKCVHKSIVQSLSKSLKQKATKENCFSEIEGIFLRQYDVIFENTCGNDYKTRNSYFLLPDGFDEDKINRYGRSLMNLLYKKNKKAR